MFIKFKQKQKSCVNSTSNQPFTLAAGLSALRTRNNYVSHAFNVTIIHSVLAELICIIVRGNKLARGHVQIVQYTLFRLKIQIFYCHDVIISCDISVST